MSKSNEIKKSFPAMVGKNPEYLILGTMPGEKSIAAQKYYAHPQNQFWRLIKDIYNLDDNLSYPEKLEYLLNQKIALWDVLEKCQRTGSADSAILAAKANDFKSFFNNHATIHTLLFTSKKAEAFFRRYVSENVWKDKKLKTLPSPSPAYASMRYEQKLEIWRKNFKSI